MKNSPVLVKKRRGRPPGKQPLRFVGINIPIPLFIRLEQILRKTQRTMTKEFIIALEKHINSQEQE